MLGFTVRTRQNCPGGSLRSVGSSTMVGSPRLDSPRSTNSPSAGEIDTRAPFESVKAALSLFKEVGSPSSRAFTKRSKADERVLEKETQHQMILREVKYYKDRLRNAETEKVRALKELQRAKQTLEQLTNKLETLSESKQAAMKATEAAKNRTRELEEQKALRAQLGSEAWKVDVNTERERYKASTQELLVCKQEISTLRHDFDAALEKKLLAFQQAEEAQHSKLIAEKQALVLKYGSAKEEARKEIERLREEFDPKENLEEKLEETEEAIKVLREQLNDVRASDFCKLETIVSELDVAKNTLLEVLAESDSIQSSLNQLKSEMEEVRMNCSELEMKVAEAELMIEKMQAELEKMKSELEMQSSLKKLLAEAEKARHEEEEIKKSIELSKREAEEGRVSAKEAEEKLQVALKQAGVAKAAEKLADDQVHNSPKTRAGEMRKIRLSAEEFELIKRKIKQFGNEADVKVAMALAQVETIKASEKQVLQKFEAKMKESKDVQLEIKDNLKRAEMAEAAKKVVENELRKWRQKEDSNVGEMSHSIKAR